MADQLILQLITDCKRKNSLKYFRKLDRLLVKKSIPSTEESDLSNLKLKAYIKNLNKLDRIFADLMAFKLSDGGDDPALGMSEEGFLPATVSAEELTGILSLVTGTIKDIRESKEKRVEKITALLDETRLSPLEELYKGKTKEAEKKKDDK